MCWTGGFALATMVDQLSGGRLELGMSAGWMKTHYEQLGMPYDRPSVRIARLGEAVQIIKGPLAGETSTPESTWQRSMTIAMPSPKSSHRPWAFTPNEAKNSPHALVGTVEQCIETIESWRERWGISYMNGRVHLARSSGIGRSCSIVTDKSQPWARFSRTQTPTAAALQRGQRDVQMFAPKRPGPSGQTSRPRQHHARWPWHSDRALRHQSR